MAAPFRLTLQDAKAKWPQWQAAQDQRRERARRTGMERFDSPVVVSFLLDVYVPRLPSPTEVVAHALELECGHEEFWLTKKDEVPKPAPERCPCPVAWSCRFSGGRSVVRYLAASEPEPQLARLGFTTWHVELACGHGKPMFLLESDHSIVGETTSCPVCQPDVAQADIRICAVGRRLPDQMVQNWTVELDCGHAGTDFSVPVESSDDPAAYRAQHPRCNGLSCFAAECVQRQVLAVRRLGLIGKVAVPKVPPVLRDPVTSAADDIRRRLTKDQRAELIRMLETER